MNVFNIVCGGWAGARNLRSRILLCTVLMTGSGAIRGQAIEVVAPGVKAEVEVVTLTPTGFFPTRLVRPTGPFLLALENRSGLREDLDLRLEGSAQQALKAYNLKQRTLDFGEVVRLPPGIYKLRVQGKGKFELTLEIK